MTCGNDRRVVCDTDSVTSGFAGERGYRSEVPRKPSRLFARALRGRANRWLSTCGCVGPVSVSGVLPMTTTGWGCSLDGCFGAGGGGCAVGCFGAGVACSWGASAPAGVSPAPDLGPGRVRGGLVLVGDGLFVGRGGAFGRGRRDHAARPLQRVERRRGVRGGGERGFGGLWPVRGFRSGAGRGGRVGPQGSRRRRRNGQEPC